MKIPKKDILLLVGFIGVLAAVCSYYFAYLPTMEKVQALGQENQALRERSNDLNAKMENRYFYLAEIERMNQEMEMIFERFPVDIKEEDGVLLAINQELTAPMTISSIGIGACEPVILNASEADTEHAYETDMPSTLMNRSVTLNYLASYEGLKRGIKGISMQDNRMSISRLSVSYDVSTGLLSGTTIVNMYCIPGQPDKEYVQPDFSSVLLGADNLFGSIELYDGSGFADVYAAENEAGGEGAEE